MNYKWEDLARREFEQQQKAWHRARRLRALAYIGFTGLWGLAAILLILWLTGCTPY